METTTYTTEQAIEDMAGSLAAWKGYKRAAELANDARKVKRADAMIERLGNHLDLLQGNTALYS